MRQLDDLPGEQIFSYRRPDGEVRQLTSADVNAYIRRVTGGDFTAKDFRTLGGTLLALATLCRKSRPSSDRQRRKRVTACMKSVAKRLGNTPAVAKSSYVHPGLIERYLNGDDLAKAHQAALNSHQADLGRNEEHCLLALFRPPS
jgi:DNA topoisomerase-1